MMTNYVSCACNRAPHCLDWGKNGLICYGACNAIAIYDFEMTKHGKVQQTLHRHTERVNVVRWIKPIKPMELETEFISASSDGSAIIWSNTKNLCFEATSVLQIGEPLSICNTLSKSSNSILICIGSINGNFNICQRNCDSKEILHLQKLFFNKKLALEAKFSYLPNSENIILSVALEDSTIQIFSQYCISNDHYSEFVKIQVLIGHRDWITCLDFTYDDNNDILLASGSQDNLIRLWRISPKKEEIQDNNLRVKKQTFVVNNEEYDVVLESIFNGHDNWIYGLHWHPLIKVNDKFVQPMKLLSSSLDKTMIIWQPDKQSGIWSEAVRVGEVGGNSLGFYGCKFGPDGNSMLAHGYQGSFHIWKHSKEDNNWLPRTAPSGHFGEVVDLCWDPFGR